MLCSSVEIATEKIGFTAKTFHLHLVKIKVAQILGKTFGPYIFLIKRYRLVQRVKIKDIFTY
jgi:hypothetical protein